MLSQTNEPTSVDELPFSKELTASIPFNIQEAYERALETLIPKIINLQEKGPPHYPDGTLEGKYTQHYETNVIPVLEQCKEHQCTIFIIPEFKTRIRSWEDKDGNTHSADYPEFTNLAIGIEPDKDGNFEMYAPLYGFKDISEDERNIIFTYNTERQRVLRFHRNSEAPILNANEIYRRQTAELEALENTIQSLWETCCDELSYLVRGYYENLEEPTMDPEPYYSKAMKPILDHEGPKAFRFQKTADSHTLILSVSKNTISDQNTLPHPAVCNDDDLIDYINKINGKLLKILKVFHAYETYIIPLIAFEKDTSLKVSAVPNFSSPIDKIRKYIEEIRSNWSPADAPSLSIEEP